MPHRPERSSPQTKLARTGRSDLTHRRAASSTLPPCWQLMGFGLSCSRQVTTRSSRRRCDQGRPKEDSEQSVRLFVSSYFYHDSMRSWYGVPTGSDLRARPRLQSEETRLTEASQLHRQRTLKCLPADMSFVFVFLFFRLFPVPPPGLLSKYFKAIGRKQTARLRLWTCVRKR